MKTGSTIIVAVAGIILAAAVNAAADESASMSEAPADSSGQPSAQAHRLHQEGHQYFNQGNYSEALKRFTSAMKITDQSTDFFKKLERDRILVRRKAQSRHKKILNNIPDKRLEEMKEFKKKSERNLTAKPDPPESG